MNELENTLSFEAFRERGEWFGQQSLIAGWLERLSWPALDVIDNELMTRTRSTSRFREFNNVFSTRIGATNPDRDVRRCLEILAEDDAPCRWYLPGNSVHSNIAEQLNSLGFDEIERHTIMAADLNGAVEKRGLTEDTITTASQLDQQDFDEGNVAGLQYGIVTDETTLKKWTETFAKVNKFSAELELDWLDMLLSCGFQNDRPWKHYFCVKHGYPIGILSALWTEQIVSFETIGVLADDRNQGIGSNLMRYALADAAKAGYHVAAAYPVDCLRPFFSKNLFEKVGAIDCFTIAAVQSSNTVQELVRDTIALPITPTLGPGETTQANI